MPRGQWFWLLLRRNFLRPKEGGNFSSGFMASLPHSELRSVLAKFAAHVTSASEGAVTDKDLEL